MDEALSLTIGLGSIEAGTFGADEQGTASIPEAIRAKARSIIGEYAFDGEAQALVVGYGLGQEGSCGDGLLIRIDGSKGNAGVVVDGDIEPPPV